MTGVELTFPFCLNKSRKPTTVKLVEELMNAAGCLHVMSKEGSTVAAAAARFDFSPAVKGNGFRSLLKILTLAVARLEVGVLCV